MGQRRWCSLPHCEYIQREVKRWGGGGSPTDGQELPAFKHTPHASHRVNVPVSLSLNPGNSFRRQILLLSRI